MVRRSGLLLTLIGLAGQPSCGGGAQNSSIQPGNADVSATSGLGPGDVVQVRVHDEDGISDEYRVSDDGMLALPFIEPIRVQGLDAAATGALVEKEYRDRKILKNPQVTVFIKDARSQRVTVLGAVQKPGTFPVTAGMTLVEVISAAGGFTAMASRNGTVLIRSVSGKAQRYRIPVDEVTDGRRDDVTVLGGDIVKVPERVF